MPDPDPLPRRRRRRHHIERSARGLAFLLLVGLAACLPPAVERIPFSQLQRSDTTYQSEGKTVVVERVAPPHRGRHAAVLVLHSSGGMRFRSGAVVHRYADEVASDGMVAWVVHYFDRTGDGTTTDAEEDARYPVWTHALEDAVSMIQRDPQVDPSRIGVVGVSLGGFMALALGREDRRVRALAVVSGGFFPGLRPQVRHLPPTLLQHGTADDVVPVAEALAVDTTLRHLGVRHATWLYPGQGHTFDGDVDELVHCRVLDFLFEELHPRFGRRTGDRDVHPNCVAPASGQEARH